MRYEVHAVPDGDLPDGVDRVIVEREDAFLVYGHDADQWPTLRKAPEVYD